jgi:pimeloyl-ACP methyl ester carboxylesterase
VQRVPEIERPDGARIHYEVRGTGFPLLLFAPGGINSQVSFWSRSLIDPFELADEFMVIGMNQRNAELSPAPLKPPTWEEHAADQRAVLEALGISRALLYGGCIGGAYVLRFIMEAPDMVAAGAAQDPVGLADGVNTRATFFAMFEPTVAAAKEGGMAAVVAAAKSNPLFVMNNAGGPFAARIATDEAFCEEVLRLTPAEYERLILDYDDSIWGRYDPFMSVEESFVPTCPAPLLIIPGNDPFHPTAISHRICREAPNGRCLGVDCRTPAKMDATKRELREFFRAHTK